MLRLVVQIFSPYSLCRALRVSVGVSPAVLLHSLFFFLFCFPTSVQYKRDFGEAWYMDVAPSDAAGSSPGSWFGSNDTRRVVSLEQPRIIWIRAVVRSTALLRSGW